jgi:hypothetical protein
MRGLALLATIVTLTGAGVARLLDDGTAAPSRADGATTPRLSSAPAGDPPAGEGGASDRPRRSRPTGVLHVVRGSSEPSGRGAVRRFLVEVEGGLAVDRHAFADAVVGVLLDRRSWVGTGAFALQRVTRPPVEFRVTLASPRLTDRLCAPLETNGRYSCFAGGRAVLNFRRWTHGAAAYGDRLGAYRTYLVNHEVGHGLGHSHLGCPAAGEPAPVMMQQTMGVGACRPNPWPLASER